MIDRHMDIYYTNFSTSVFHNKTTKTKKEFIYIVYQDDKLLFPEIPSGGSIGIFF